MHARVSDAASDRACAVHGCGHGLEDALLLGFAISDVIQAVVPQGDGPPPARRPRGHDRQGGGTGRHIFDMLLRRESHRPFHRQYGGDLTAAMAFIYCRYYGYSCCSPSMSPWLSSLMGWS